MHSGLLTCHTYMPCQRVLLGPLATELAVTSFFFWWKQRRARQSRNGPRARHLKVEAGQLSNFKP